MKKMFTLLLSVGFFATTHAQTNRQQNDYNFGRNSQNVIASRGGNNNSYDRNGHGIYDNRNNSFARERNAQNDKINSEFNYKIMAVENNPYMRNRQKRMQIRDLTYERNRQLQMVNSRYNDQYKSAYKNDQGWR
jgi:hypothetical protein